MLPNPALKPAYERAVWIYVYRDFQGGELDRHAERISLRFGVSSWPQLFLADPRSLEILAHTGRKTEGFLRALEGTSVKRSRSLEMVDGTIEAERQADALERKRSVKKAMAALDSDDMVLRIAAVRVLADKKPEGIVSRAEELLKVANDPLRYEVCAVLEREGAGARALEALLIETGPSLNPNVVRIRAVKALAKGGDVQSVEAIAHWAATGEYFNGLTGTAVDALAAIAKRDRKARVPVREALRRAYPEPPDPSDARAMRACVALAERVHKALGARRGFPKIYDAEARERLMRGD
ncbi:MAG: hypothetical protein ACYSX0_18770 [Planctomycetota bacterium]